MPNLYSVRAILGITCLLAGCAEAGSNDVSNNCAPAVCDSATQPPSQTRQDSSGAAKSDDGSTQQQRDDDAAIFEFGIYVKMTHAPLRVVQVDLPSHPKNNQYDARVVYSNLSVSGGLGLGYLACGLLSVSSHLRLPDDAGKKTLLNYPLLGWLKAAAGRAYGAEKGIQPTNLAHATRAVLGNSAVRTDKNWTLAGIHQALAAGDIVIVDMLAGTRGSIDVPTQDAPNYSHFARVLGIDMAKKEIYLENTLLPATQSYWTLSLADFMTVWRQPETRASQKPAGLLEDVMYWGMRIKPDAIATPPSAVSVACGDEQWIDTCQSNNATLLYCSTGSAQYTTCPNHCIVQPVGQNDFCN